jgi:hypothetical protein
MPLISPLSKTRFENSRYEKESNDVNIKKIILQLVSILKLKYFIYRINVTSPFMVF